jgi:retinol dehydrogenase-14
MPGFVLITGATSGIGYATAQELTRAGVPVLLCGRDLAGATAAAERLSRESPGAVIQPVHADHQDLGQVRELADSLAASTPGGAGLAAAVLAAGVFVPREQRTVDGLDPTLTVNHLAPFLLGERLGPTIAADGGRVVLLGSAQHTAVKAADLDPATFDATAAGPRRYEGTKALMLLALKAHALASRRPLHVAVDPGFVRTNLGRTATGAFRLMLTLTRPMQVAADRPARLIHRVLDDPDVQNGAYVGEKGPARRSPLTDDEAAARTWDAWTRKILTPWL